ncbi:MULTISPECIES: RHS repeat-associated core domain-containing protein [unclassified Kitasatospora]|uniref:RHS repeat-associated core domain-containing protein n=1 Tax=unclassified Kitasatospora TaxID=2633591 RepID=UPI0024746B20|nr:RHS repeat-associated core domain-containing protein [Kitasatospora sp. MAP12-44]
MSTAMAGILAMGATSAMGQVPAPKSLAPHASAPSLPATPSVKNVVPVAPKGITRPASAPAYRPVATTWPKAANATVTLGAPAATQPGAAPAAAAVGPVTLTPLAPKSGSYQGPSSAQVSVKDQATAAKAGVNGVLFTVNPATDGAGAANVRLDYSAFAQAYGAGYGSRLTLVELPACALTTPQVAACRVQHPLGATNNAKSKQLSAQLQLQAVGAPSTAGISSTAPAASGSAVKAAWIQSSAVKPQAVQASASTSNAMVLAAVSGSGGGDGGGPTGSFGSTSLKAAGSWEAGTSSGSWTYSYPMTVPPASSALTPKLSLDYDSGSVDGQTAASQAQSGWAGDGWSMPQSFIEQSFTSCSDNPEGSASPTSTGDECYAGPILTLSLNGASTALVWDSTHSSWKAADDNGDVVTHVTGANNGDGTYNTDYYTVTDRQGTTYSFGRNQLPGWTSGKPTTNSVDTEPVYSAHAGDPCYNAAGFTSSVCTMGYRYNLDYVKDVHGNAMSYYYDQNTNYYGQDNGAANTSYVRDSHLDHIDYGFTDGNAFGTVADKVAFNTADRCTSGTASCDPLNSTTQANWPDVPYDLACASGTTCSSYSPAFYSTVRLASIATEQYNTTTSGYNTVDTYTLTHTLPVTADGGATLWLASIAHTGSDTRAGGTTTPITLPSVSFGSVDMPNRVDTSVDGLPALYRYRIATVTTETGSVIGVQYGQTSPCTAPVTTSPASNTSSCYPVYWTPQGYTAPILDWFNKYVVQKVTQSDPTGGAVATATSYQYSGAAWHFDDDEVVQPKNRTYGQWRGYGDVKTFNGDITNDKQTESETTYYQGMSDDNNTTAVTLTDSQGGTHDDNDLLAGSALEQTSYLGAGGPVDHSAITSYWVSPATASRNRIGLPALTANKVVPVEEWSRQALTDGGTTTWRVNETDTAYDATTTDADFGLPTAVYTHTVPANPAYDQCSLSNFAAPNTAANLVGLPSGSETDAVACGGFTEGTTSSVPGSVNTLTAPGSVTRPDQVVSATRTLYDDPTDAAAWPQPSYTFPQTAAPTKGDTSIHQKLTGYTGSTPVWTTQSTEVNDSAGRPTDSYNAAGAKTHLAYTTDAVGLITATTATNALGQSASTTVDPARNLSLTSTDLNGVVTTDQYDPLGRITAAWSDSRATTLAANATYTYTVSNTGITAVTTDKLDEASSYVVSTVLYDAMARPRQTQSSTPQGGRMVTDTFYDSRGWKASTYNGWWDSATGPNTTLVSAANLKDEVPNQDYYTYDGLGRVVVDQSEKDNLLVSATTTVYNGDRTTVIPPSGGTVKSTLTDPLGRSSELDSYTAAPTLNTPADTFAGIWSVSGGTSQATTYGYDSHGNQNTTTASGSTWTTTYDMLGQAVSKQDPDAGTSTMAYDAVGNLVQATDSRGKTTSSTYDALGRQIGSYDAPVSGQSTTNRLTANVYDNSNNAVTGMKYPLGHLTTATSYDSTGLAYTTQAMNFNVFGESLGEKVTIPASPAAGSLAATYTFQHSYSTTTGLPAKSTIPAAGGMAAETVGYSYIGALDLPSGIGGLNVYAQSTSYDAYGHVQQETLGTGTTTQAFITDTYDPHTSALTDQLVTRSTNTPSAVDEQNYTYDPAGNITKQVSTRLGAATATETQCYQYDALDRLNQAWTATDSCAATPATGSSSTVGDQLSGGSAYWTAWTFDALGQRTSQVAHSTTGGTDTTTGYTYNGNGTNQPHTLTGTSTTGASTSTTSAGYDSAGNTTARTTPSAGTQNLTWNDAGQLTQISGGTAGTTNYVYGPDGSVLLQEDPGTTTLYLPGEQLTLNTTTNTTSGNRYYPMPGGGTAVRTGTGSSSTYAFEITDQHGTSGLSLDATAQNPTWRQFTPYGAPRGTTGTWNDSRGFLNAPTNTDTGLTLLGARQYDTTTGRFISLDPLFEATDDQLLNGYTYTADNPIGQADPSGLRPDDCAEAGFACGSGPGGTTTVTDPEGEVVNEQSGQVVAKTHPPHTYGVGPFDPGSWGDSTGFAQRHHIWNNVTNKKWDDSWAQARAQLAAQEKAEAAARASEAAAEKQALQQQAKSTSGGFSWSKAGLAAGAVGLTAADIAQLGLDPVTDAADAADIGALAASGDAAAGGDVAAAGGDAAAASGDAAAASGDAAAASGDAAAATVSDDSSAIDWKAEWDALPRGKQSHVKLADSPEDLRGLFDRWTSGADRLPARGPKIPDVMKLQDGPIMQWRVVSGSGGETIDIDRGVGDILKVHL